MGKILKSIVSTGMAAVLSLTMCMSVFASASPEKNGVVTEVVQAVDSNGNSVEIKIEEIPEEYKEVVEVLQNPTSLREILTTLIEAAIATMPELADVNVENMALLDVREVTLGVDPSTVKFPIDITFEVPGVLETSKVMVLHYVDGAWKIEKSKAGKGTITATFDSLSPVAFLVDKTTTASSTVSPKTAVRQMAPAVVAVVGILAAGVLIIRRRKSSI